MLENVIKGILGNVDTLDLEGVDSKTPVIKYEHKEYVNTNELLERIDKLEKEKELQAERIDNLEKDNKVQAETNSLFHSRLSYLEKEYIFLLRYHTKENAEETEKFQDTLVSDDQNKNTLMSDDQNKETLVIDDQNQVDKEISNESEKGSCRVTFMTENDKAVVVNRKKIKKIKRTEVDLSTTPPPEEMKQYYNNLFDECIERTLRTFKYMKSNISKKEESKEYLKAIRNEVKFFRDTNSEEIKTFIGKVETSYIKWISCKKNKFEVNAEKDLEELIKMVEHIISLKLKFKDSNDKTI